MKTVLFISPTGTMDNGAERSIINLMLLLKKKGYNVHNIFPQHSNPSQENYIQKMTEHGIAYASLPLLNWWWEEAPVFLKGTFEQRASFYHKYIFDIRSYIKENRIDVVISNTSNVFQGALAAAFEEVEHYWMIHEFPLGEFAYYKDYFSLMLSLSDYVFAVEGYLTKTLSSMCEKDSCVLSFIPYSDFNSQELEVGDSRRLISIGHINNNKNQIELLKAYIALGNFALPLVFIGGWDTEVKEELDKLIEAYQLNSVQFVGYHPNPWSLVTQKDICVLTSQSEAFPLVFVESILKGVPTIVSDNLGYQSVQNVFKAGISYKLGDISELKNTLQEVLDNFEQEKKRSTALQLLSKELYHPESSYASLLDCLTKEKAHNSKVISPLSFLIGSYDTLEDPWFLSGQQLNISITSVCDGLEIERTENKVLEHYQDEWLLLVSETDTKIRLVPSGRIAPFIQISLYDPNAKHLVEPADTEIGFEKYIEYDVSSLRNKQICIKYQITSTYELYREGLFDKKIQEYQHYKQQYETVTNSFRWRFITKIINFIRGNKL